MRTGCVMRAFVISLLCLCASFGIAHAQSDVGALSPVIDDDLLRAFSGTTMDGVYKMPRERSGTNLFTEMFNADGTTVYREGKINDTGAWIIAKNNICFSYNGPMAGGYSCFRVFRAGTCYYSYAPNQVKNGKPIEPNRWSVKTVIRGDVSTCDNLVS